MKSCPVCKSEMDDDRVSCPACGYHLQGATEKFHVVEVEPDSAESNASSSSVSSLTVLYGKQKGLVYQLDADQASIGRSPKCDIFLNDMTVSREHALLERVEGGWSLRDMGSFNGVWVNNVNVDHVMLTDHDIIQIGCFILRYAE